MKALARSNASSTIELLYFENADGSVRNPASSFKLLTMFISNNPMAATLLKSGTPRSCVASFALTQACFFSLSVSSLSFVCSAEESESRTVFIFRVVSRRKRFPLNSNLCPPPRSSASMNPICSASDAEYRELPAYKRRPIPW